MRDLPLPDNPKSHLPGNLLIAAPLGGNDTMAGAVILVLEHSAEGAQGVVLNSQANEAMKSWCRQMSTQPDKRAVFEQLQEVASSAAHMAEQGTVLPLTVCMSKPAESMEDMVGELGRGVRIFVGRITWQAGELEQQTSAGNWMITPAEPELVFGDHENLWQTCVHRVGEDVVRSALGVGELMVDVLVN
jgi:putative transcriptional regulator